MAAAPTSLVTFWVYSIAKSEAAQNTESEEVDERKGGFIKNFVEKE